MTLLTYDGKGFKSAWSAGLNDKYYATTNTRNEAVVNGLTVAKAYNVVSYVFRCVKIICNEISRLPRALVDETGRDVTEQYKDLMVTDDLLYSMTGSKYLFGAAYAKKERNDYGFNPQLRWLISPSVQPRVNPVTRLVDGFIRAEECPPFIPVEDMVYIWNKNYTDETQPGAGDSQVALGPASAIYAKDVLIANFFNGGAIKVTVFPVNPSTPEPDRINFQNWLNRRLSNVQNAFKNIVMRATDLNPVVIGSDIKDTEAVELTTQAREDIAAAHGMTVSIVNGDYKYATADDQYINFILQTVVPEADRMFEAFTKQYYADFGLKLITQPKKLEVMQNLQLAQSSAVSQATGKPVMLVSEGRELLELKTDLTPDEQQQLGIAPAPVAGTVPAPVNAVPVDGKPIRVDNWPVGKPKRVNFDEAKPVAVKSTNAHPGAMLAFMLSPNQSALLGKLDGQTADHMTLIFVTDDAKTIEDKESLLLQSLSEFAKRVAPFMIEISGYGRFDNDGEQSAIYASVDSPSLPNFRADLLSLLRTIGIEPVLNHGFSPHITLGYIEPMVATPDIALPQLAFSMDSVSLVSGGKRYDFALTGSQTFKSLTYDELTAALTEWRKEAIASVKAGKSVKIPVAVPDDVSRPIMDALQSSKTAAQVRAVFESHWPRKPEAEAAPVDELKRGNDLLAEVISLLKSEK